MSEWKSMSLSTIDRAPQKKSEVLQRFNTRETNRISDISGAAPLTTPETRFLKISNRSDFMTSVKDIEGTTPKPYISKKPKEVLDYHLRNDDIEGSRPMMNKIRISRQTNPVEPTYILPTSNQRPITPPKFLRDPLDISDIREQEPKSLHGVTVDLSKPPKPTQNIDDIQGAKPIHPHKFPQRVRLGSEQGESTMTNVKDINNYMTFKSKRVTNPLNPEYTISGDLVGEIKGNAPKNLPRTRQDRPDFSLTTSDIEKQKRTNLHQLDSSFPPENARRDFRSINKTEDIPGASHSSGINYTTMHRSRKAPINPLNPNYLDAKHSKSGAISNNNSNPSSGRSTKSLTIQMNIK